MPQQQQGRAAYRSGWPLQLVPMLSRMASCKTGNSNSQQQHSCRALARNKQVTRQTHLASQGLLQQQFCSLCGDRLLSSTAAVVTWRAFKRAHFPTGTLPQCCRCTLLPPRQVHITPAGHPGSACCKRKPQKVHAQCQHGSALISTLKLSGSPCLQAVHHSQAAAGYLPRSCC